MKHSTDSRRTRNFLKASAEPVIIISAVILIVLSAVSLFFGSYPLDLFKAGGWDGMSEKVFFELRLPRILAGILAGGVLGVTGGICQTVFSNPLASPDITGVASGASLGASAAILAGYAGIIRTVFAFFGGMAALAVLLFFVRISGGSGTEVKGRYLIAGILVSSAADAGLMILKTAADPEKELAAIEFWTMGSFASVTSGKFLLMLASSAVPLILLFAFYRQALILSRGHDASVSLGVSPSLWQAVLLSLSTWAVAGVVSLVGVIGFVGLIVPHMALCATGSRSRGFLPLCFIFGACVTVVSDLLARALVPGSELPVSIFCVLFAVAWFFFMFCRGKAAKGGLPC